MAFNKNRTTAWLASLGAASLFALAAHSIDPSPGHTQDLPSDDVGNNAGSELELTSNQEDGVSNEQATPEEPPCYTPLPTRGFRTLEYKYYSDSPPAHLREAPREIKVDWAFSSDGGEIFDTGYIGPDHPDFDKLMETPAPKPCPVWI